METVIKKAAEEKAKTTMSVLEMGRLLGLKKTEAYLLVHKNLFETVLVNGIMRVRTDSFERWYANQIRRVKVDGEAPGSELRETSWSVPEIAGMLAVTDDTVYELIRRGDLETFEVDSRMRVRKDTFDAWYQSQSRFRTQEDREKEASLEESSITFSQMAGLLGISRREAYAIVSAKKNEGAFDIVTVAERKRITKDSFEKWYGAQERYQKPQKKTSGLQQELEKAQQEVMQKRQQLLLEEHTSFSVKDTALLMGISVRDVYRMIEKETLDSFLIGKMVRIRRTSIEWWLSPQEDVFRREES